MIEKLKSMVKDKITEIVAENSEIPAGEKEKVSNDTTNSIVEAVKGYMTTDNLFSLASMIGVDKSGSGFGSSSMLENIQNKVVATLTQKTGLSSTAAQSIAVSAVPALISILSKRFKNDPTEDSGGFSLESLTELV